MFLEVHRWLFEILSKHLKQRLHWRCISVHHLLIDATGINFCCRSCFTLGTKRQKIPQHHISRCREVSQSKGPIVWCFVCGLVFCLWRLIHMTWAKKNTGQGDLQTKIFVWMSGVARAHISFEGRLQYNVRSRLVPVSLVRRRTRVGLHLN